VTFFPFLLTAHIGLAVALFLPSLLLPFTLRGRRREEVHGRFVRLLLSLQGSGTLVIGLGVALTGILLLLTLGPQLLAQPWLLLALAIYAANLLISFFVQRPNLRRLVGVRPGSEGPDEAEERRWRDRARRQRYVSYAMAGLVGVIAFLMSTKPRLW
jgi:hypothetical protein